ncbi:bacteriocin secretion accessory protein [Streptococcus oricebi]|uniref:Competence protein ComB n=1 Tax=Streptococcus oricebi TaxID=1547447 RepID=A0ABS5B5M8_9STRE|nr:bacteriocin secretion accessory protein [Streptococcus oricebi]MBP2624148.1 competence protein ComB [Streptococcus oricebi]
MDERFLESAEFYQKRYHNFSSMLILPSCLLFLFVLGFAFLAKKEITISSKASIEASRVLANIQSTSSNPIISNHLAENKEVKKGDLLIQYQTDNEETQQNTLASQLNSLRNQKTQLELLKSSIEAGQNQFSQADSYGYEQSFKDYQSQISSLTDSVNQQNSNIAAQNAASTNSQAELGALLTEAENKLADYRNLKTAIQTDKALSSTSSLYSLYQTYAKQLEQAEGRQAVKEEILSQIEAQISQLEGTISNYRIQYAGSGTQQAYTGSLASQLASLKAQQLAKVSQELTGLTQQILEAENNLKLQEGITQKGQITAESDGLLHLNSQVLGSTLVPEGTVLAQLYPAISKEKQVKIVALVSSKDVSTIKKGDKVRFITQDDANKQITLHSEISNIDTKATETESGNYFRVECVTNLTQDQANVLKYGLEGKFIMITGQKTYFSYYRDKIFNLN